MPKKIKAKEMKAQQTKIEEIAKEETQFNLKSDSEKRAEQWLIAFDTEISQIENFYKTKLEEIIASFIKMQAKYLMKLEHDEQTNQNDSQDSNEDINEQSDKGDYQLSRIYVNPVNGHIIKNDKGSIDGNEQNE